LAIVYLLKKYLKGIITIKTWELGFQFYRLLLKLAGELGIPKFRQFVKMMLRYA